MKIRTIIFLLATTFTLTLVGQTKVSGRYFVKSGMMGNELKIQKKHSFKLSKINWESGNGNIHYGKWILRNDTLVLEYKYFRNVKGVGRARTKTSLRREKEMQSEKLIISGDSLCFSLPVNNNCYKKK